MSQKIMEDATVLLQTSIPFYRNILFPLKTPFNFFTKIQRVKLIRSPRMFRQKYDSEHFATFFHIHICFYALYGSGTEHTAFHGSSQKSNELANLLWDNEH